MQTIFSDQELRNLAADLAEIIMPQVKEFVKGKAEWTVRELSTLSGEYYTVRELAEQFHLSEKHIRNMIDEGMPVVRFDNAIRIEKSLIKDAISSGKVHQKKVQQ